MTFMDWVRFFGAMGTYGLIGCVAVLGRNLHRRLCAVEDRNTARDEAVNQWAIAYVQAAPAGKYWRRREARLFEAVTGAPVPKEWP